MAVPVKISCSICLSFASDNPAYDWFVTTIKCGHLYHHLCLRRSLRLKKECPTCRKTLEKHEVTRCYYLPAPNDMPIYDCQFSLIVLGKSGVGKSTLLRQYVDGIFQSTWKTTIGCDMKFREIVVNSRRIKLTLWDTGGHDQFEAITPNYFRNIHGVLLVYDIADKGSLDKAEFWYHEAKLHLPDAEYILLGNKADKFMERQLTTMAGQSLATRLEIPFFETSAMESWNVEAAFRTLASNIFINEDLRGPLPISTDTPFQLPLQSSLTSTTTNTWDSDSEINNFDAEDDIEATWWNRWASTWRSCIPF